MVGQSFIFYYFILTYKKLTPMKILWNLLCQYNNIYKREKKVQTEDWEKKKFVTTVATMPLGTVATVQNLKKKKRQSGSPKWHCRWTVLKL